VAAAAGTVPPLVSSLLEGVIQMLWIKKATAATVALFATFALGVGVGLSTRTEQVAAVAQDKPPAEERPASPDVEAKLALLRAQMDVAQARHLLAVNQAKTAPDKVTADRFLVEAERAAQEVVKLKAEIELIRAAREKNQPKPKPAPNSDPKLADLEAKLAVLSKQLADVEAAHADARRRTDVLAQQAQALQGQAEVLRAKREEILRALEGQKTKLGAHLEITVTAKDALWPCRVKEFGADGRLIGSVIAEDLNILGPLLRRIAKDPTGPKEVRVVIHRDAPGDRSRAVLDACKQAGFETSSTKWLNFVPVPDLPPDEPGPTKNSASREPRFPEPPPGHSKPEPVRQ
jgi:hypothetical protein